MKKLIASISAAVLGLVSTASQAAIDTLAVEGAFADLGTAQVTVGGLLLVAAVTAVTYKWVKGMLFG